jgi:hypothetical protein
VFREGFEFLVKDRLDLAPAQILGWEDRLDRIGRGLDLPAPGYSGPGLEGHTAGDPMQPAGQAFRKPDRLGSARQDQKGSLQGIFSFLAMPEHGLANVEDHRPMPVDQVSESRFITSVEEALE